MGGDFGTKGAGGGGGERGRFLEPLGRPAEDFSEEESGRKGTLDTDDISSIFNGIDV